MVTGDNFVEAMNKMPPPEAKLYSGFSRRCSFGKKDCQFTSRDSPDNSLYFKCRENDICFCSRGSAPENELVWPVTWEDGKCLVGKGGPCGDDKGLTVGCMHTLSCIQGRCRNSSEINNGNLHQNCNDDVDCISGLSCHEPSQQMEIRIKRCLTIWFKFGLI